MESPSPVPAAAPRRAARSTYAFTTRRPVAILMAVMAVCVFGWVSYKRLALTLMPDISYPTLTVRTEYPGTAPEEIENLVSRPLEQELGVVPRLVRINSISKAGQSDVILEFAWNADMNAVAQDIREKVDRVRLPDAAERPLLLRYDPSLDSIIRVGIHGPQTLFELRYLSEHEIKRALESIDGVAAVKVKGGLEEEFQVQVDERKLSLLGLDINTLNNRLAAGNVNLPGGNLREGQTEYLVRTMNEFRTLEEIGELIIARQPAGIDVRLRDVATVTASNKEREVITRVNGRESIEIEIYKEAGANVVEVARRVRSMIYGLPEQRAYAERLKQEGPATKAASDTAKKPDEQRREQAARAVEKARMTDYIEYRLPAGSAIDVLSDQSTFIQQSIDEVKSNAIIGGLIAVVVLYLFLRNVVHTLIIGVTIPVSIIATFAPMHIWDVSLNIISLGGLALGTGNLVDNAIVVLESIFRCREEGDDLATAVIRGTGEVGSAVTASTFTTVVAFLPIVFVEGVAGQIFGDMALTVVFSQIASLIVGLLVIPMLASRQLGGETSSLATMSGSSPTGFTAGAFLRFEPLPEKPTQAQRVGLLGALLGSLVTRLVLATLAILAVVACAVASLLGLVSLVWFNRTAKWLAGTGDGFLDRHVWAGIGRSPALQHLGASLERRWTHCREARGFRRVLRATGSTLILPLLVLRFVYEVVLRAFGQLILLAAFLVVMPLIVLTRFATLALHPIVAPLLFLSDAGMNGLQRVYRRALGWSLDHAGTLATGCVALFLFAVLVGLPRIGRELVPQVSQGEFNIDVTMPVGTPLERTAGIIAGVERVVLAQPEVARAATSVGTDEGASSGAEEGEHTGHVTILLRPGSSPEVEKALIARIRAAVQDIPEMKVEVSYPALFTFKAPIEVEVRGYDLVTLRRLSREVEQRLRDIPGLADVQSTLQAGNPELQVIYHRDRLAEFGLNLRTVAELVRNKVQGHVATDFRQRERQIDVLVRLEESDRLGVQELRNLIVNPGSGVPIPLEAVASITVAEGPSEVRRIDQQRTALITANTTGLDLGSASVLIEDAMRQIAFPSGFHYAVAGQNEEMQRSLDSMIMALGLAFFLVYIVMASQFESLLHPFIIMFSVPLGLIGVILVLWLAAIPVSIIVFIGLIMLAGIVVNNAIVLVDFINTLRHSGVELVDAVKQAGEARLRPILMTTLTTVLGLFPMALGLGEGAEIRAPMAITVIVGLTTSTVLTLVVIPTIYVLVERRRRQPVVVGVPA